MQCHRPPLDYWLVTIRLLISIKLTTIGENKITLLISLYLNHLFFSMPIKKLASARAAYRLPFPASRPVTAYSLTKTCKYGPNMRKIIWREKKRKYPLLHILKPLDQFWMFYQIDDPLQIVG